MPHADSPPPSATDTPAPPTLNGVTLHVNDGPLAPHEVSLLKASLPTDPIEELRRRYDEDGYVLVKGLLPREDVLRAREEYFKFIAPSGVLKPGTAPVEGIFDDNRDAADFPGIGAGAAGGNGRPGGDTAATFVDLALAAHTQDWYAEEFCKHPALKEFVAKLSGWGDKTLTVRRTLLRNNTPGNRAIGVHYDQSFMRYGEPTAVTAWVPIGDVSLNGGGLIYLEEGHILGRQFENEFTEKAKAAGMTDEEAKNAFNQNMLSTGFIAEDVAGFARRNNRRWLVSSYEAGDVVFHTPYMIHASTINHDPKNAIRLGTDLRYVDSSRPWDERWNHDYRLDDGV